MQLATGSGVEWFWGLGKGRNVTEEERIGPPQRPASFVSLCFGAVSCINGATFAISDDIHRYFKRNPQSLSSCGSDQSIVREVTC